MRPSQRFPLLSMTAGQAAMLAVVAVVLGANAAFFFYFQHDSASSHLGYGGRFPRSEGTSMSGGSVSWKDRWALIGFSDVDDADGIRHIRYAASLAERFDRQGLVSVGILHGRRREAADHGRQLEGFKERLIWDDGGWAEALSLGSHAAMFYLVNPSGEVVFSSARVRNDDLRQLVELNLLGEVDYASQRGTTFLAPGRKLPRLLVSQLVSGRGAALEELSPDVAVFFSADCAICSLEDYLGQYRELVAGSKRRGLRTIAVFNGNFMQADFLEELELKPEVAESVYLATKNLEEPGNLYDFRSPLGSEVVVVRLDARGDITGVLSMEGSLEELN